jgi:hypothetical protein
MTQPSRIVCLAAFAAVVLLLPLSAAALVSVTPTVMPTPHRQLIVVTNAPHNQVDPRVDVVASNIRPARFLFLSHFVFFLRLIQ